MDQAAALLPPKHSRDGVSRRSVEAKYSITRGVCKFKSDSQNPYTRSPCFDSTCLLDTMSTQTKTPIKLLTKSSKATLVEEFVGKSLDGLRTPAMIIDRKIFSENCAKMHRKAADWGAGFRAHLKTHKVVSPIHSRHRVLNPGIDIGRSETSARLQRG